MIEQNHNTFYTSPQKTHNKQKYTNKDIPIKSIMFKLLQGILQLICNVNKYAIILLYLHIIEKNHISMEQQNIMELRSIPELFNKNYFIPEYQRGYRWESQQVKQLLEDLQDFLKKTNDASFYCLQPIVLKKCTKNVIEEYNLESVLDNNEWYEVIDGQQRLTTIRIICSILDCTINRKGKHKFNIHYATRPDMDNIYNELIADYNSDLDKIILQHIDKWKNLDSVYINNAAQVIVDWYNENEYITGKFNDLILNDKDDNPSIKVVWYEDCSSMDARDIFRQINDLSVKLSCSELIRSLFLSSATDYECDINLKGVDENIAKVIKERFTDEKQRYINTKWDEIEHRLSEGNMLNFINCRNNEVMRNKIDLLFDLISSKNSGNETEKHDPLYTFLFFNEKIKDKNIGAWKVWLNVEQYFSRLCDWMNNSNLYHKIGFLNAISKDDEILIKLLNSAKCNKKEIFNKELESMIREELATPEHKAILELDYRIAKDYSYIKKLLFFYNVELHRQNEGLGLFQFNKFKPFSDWTLEHIHAQNSECLPPDDRLLWIQWSIDNADTLQMLRFDHEKLEEKRYNMIRKLHDAAEGYKNKNKQYTHSTVVQLFNEISDLYAKADKETKDINSEPEHQLSNMTLLKKGDNSSIGCSAFAVKRNKILELYKKGSYFPIGTINVFGKILGENQQTYEWSHSDREAYLQSITKTLSSYVTID